MVDRICHCGTCKDAFDTGLKLVNEMVDNDCPLWAIQVGLTIQVATTYIMAGMVKQLGPESTLTKEMFSAYMQQMAPTLRQEMARIHELRDKIGAKTDELMPDLDQVVRELNALLSESGSKH